MDKNYLPHKVVLAPKYQMDGNIIDNPMEKMQKEIIKVFKKSYDKFVNENSDKIVSYNDVTITIDVDGKQDDITRDFFGR